MSRQLPSFKQIKEEAEKRGNPPYAAWHVWGPNDELGTLNLLTPDVVLSASKEIQTGLRVSMNWPIKSGPKHVGFGRQAVEHKIIHKSGRVVFDDTLYFNTQSGSQWDGFRHFGYQKQKRFYNDTTIEDVIKTTKIGIDAWSRAGGIATRGVLIDFWEWSKKKGREYDPFTTVVMKIQDIKECLKDQGVTLRRGDIPFIRSGFIETHATKSDDALRSFAKGSPPTAVGVETCEETLEWIWENHFAAVAGDMPAFEAWPPQSTPSNHEVLLGGWGCPIGEMFDLEALSAECKRQKRYTFFVTSSPLSVEAGVASPPNIMAVF